MVKKDMIIEENAVVEYSGSAGRAVVPEGVRAIEPDAFAGNSTLKTVILPRSLRQIGSGAFRNCENLQRIRIPNGAVDIGSEAFLGCASLADEDGFVIVTGILFDYFGLDQNVRVPCGVTAVSDSAFYGKRHLVGIELPDSVASIGAGAFCDCRGLREVILPKGLRRIERSVFEDCVSLERAVIPDGVEEIGVAAFMGCTKLEQLRLPPDEIRIASEAFRDCPALAASDGSVVVRRAQFGYYGKGGSVTVPSDVELLYEGAFANSAIKEIAIPASVRFIEKNAFSGCEELKRIRIDGTPRIAPDAFDTEVSPIERVVAPHVPLHVFDRLGLLCEAEYGFLAEREAFTDPTTVTSYEVSCIQDSGRLLKNIFENDLAKALGFYTEHGVMNDHERADRLIADAQRAGAVQCAAVLLDAAGGNVRADEVLKALETALDDETDA